MKVFPGSTWIPSIENGWSNLVFNAIKCFDLCPSDAPHKFNNIKNLLKSHNNLNLTSDCLNKTVRRCKIYSRNYTISTTNVSFGHLIFLAPLILFNIKQNRRLHVLFGSGRQAKHMYRLGTSRPLEAHNLCGGHIFRVVIYYMSYKHVIYNNYIYIFRSVFHIASYYLCLGLEYALKDFPHQPVINTVLCLT